MNNPTSLLAYPDCKKVFERAIDSLKGVRVECKDRKAAVAFMGRCNSYRRLDRKENLKIYTDPAHSLHGRSVYDGIRLRLEGHIIVFEKMEGRALQIMEIE